MTPEERQLLAGLFDRTRSAANAPRDQDAEAFIADAVRTQPYAPYVLSQTVIVMEQTLNGASQRIEQLEARVRELEARAAAAPAASSGSFLGGLFGGKPAVQPAAPSPSPWGRSAVPQSPMQGGAPGGYAPQPQQAAAPWQQPQAAPAAGGSFLKSALGTAAGVAGGVMLAHSLQGMFSGGGNSGFGGNHGSGNAGQASASGTDSLLDGPPSQQPQQANYGSSGQDHGQADSGSADAQYASTDDAGFGGGGGGGGYSDDSTDV